MVKLLLFGEKNYLRTPDEKKQQEEEMRRREESRARLEEERLRKLTKKKINL